MSTKQETLWSRYGLVLLLSLSVQIVSRRFTGQHSGLDSQHCQNQTYRGDLTVVQLAHGFNFHGSSIPREGEPQPPVPKTKRLTH